MTSSASIARETQGSEGIAVKGLLCRVSPAPSLGTKPCQWGEKRASVLVRTAGSA